MKKLYLLFLAFISGLSYSQTVSSVYGTRINQPMSVLNSPTVSNYRTFGELPPSNFIGVVDISIPVHTIKHRNYTLPIVLRYHNGMGNKVEAIPGSTGLGWHLTSGGTINLLESKKKKYDVGLEMIGRGDYVHSGDDWSTKDKLKILLGGTASGLTQDANNSRTSLRGYVFSVNFNDISGELYFDHNKKPKFRSKDNTYLEVSVTFTDNSEYYQDIVSFTLKDNKGVSYFFGGDSYTEYMYMGHSPTLSWVLPSNVGKELSNFENARKPTNTTWHIRKIVFPNKEEILFEYKRGTPIYSTKVLSNLKIMEYTKLTDYNFSDHFRGYNIYGNEEQSTATYPLYLTKISTVNEDVLFEYSDANYRSYFYDMFEHFNKGTYIGISPDTTSPTNIFMKGVVKKNIAYFQSIRLGKNGEDVMKPMDKLDLIKSVSKNGNVTKEMSFRYTDNYDEKLKLIGLDIKDPKVSSQKESYTFKYHMPRQGSPNPTSYSKDYFGFYNDNKYYLGFIENVISLPENYSGVLLFPFRGDLTLRQNYIEKRAPKVSVFNTWEILNEIVYPSGGYTKFEYEANMYGSVAKNYPFTVETNSNNLEKAAGGVRIKRVKNFDSDDKLLTSKSYAYVKNYEGNGVVSSGVLTHMPTYFDNINARFISAGNRLDYFNWSSEDIYPAHRLRGNHITYSEVTEIDDLDQSSTVFKYKNFDNGFHDKPIVNYASHYENDLKDEYGSNKNIWEKWDVISMGLERGQVISETLLDNKRKRVKEIHNEYNNSPERFNDYVRAVNLYDNHMFFPNTKTLYAFTYIASKIYTYTPYLTKKTVIDYVGNNSVINSETSYKYNDTYKLLTEKTEKRGAKTFKTTYKYPFDFTESVYTSMVNKNIVAPVILEENYINGVKALATKVNYKSYVPTYVLPMGQSSFSGGGVGTLTQYQVPKDVEVQYKNGVWEKQLEFLTYDDKMNVLSTKDITGKTTNYLWGYKKTLPIWTIENVPYSTISTALGESEINLLANAAEPSVDKLNLFKQKMDANAEIKGAFKTHYLYDPILGLTYKETPLGLKEYYKYDGFGRLIKVEDGDLNTLIEYEYNYKQN